MILHLAGELPLNRRSSPKPLSGRGHRAVPAILSVPEEPQQQPATEAFPAGPTAGRSILRSHRRGAKRIPANCAGHRRRLQGRTTAAAVEALAYCFRDGLDPRVQRRRHQKRRTSGSAFNPPRRHRPFRRRPKAFWQCRPDASAGNARRLNPLQKLHPKPSRQHSRSGAHPYLFRSLRGFRRFRWHAIVLRLASARRTTRPASPCTYGRPAGTRLGQASCTLMH